MSWQLQLRQTASERGRAGQPDSGCEKADGSDRMETGNTLSRGDPAAAYGAVNSCLRRIINRKIFDKQEFLWYER